MYDFKGVEPKILELWRNKRIFEKSLESRKKGKRFVFFEGPPTANGLPHVGHFLTRVYKDLYGRYKTMRGFFVFRKAGWDTHGLPVEIEVEKELGFKNKKDIEEYGIAKFNKKAKESVWKYKKEWEDMTTRMGFWIDLSNPYITYDSKYMESLWYIIQQISKKELLYRAHKVLPFCPRCGTSLSSHEVAQGYKKVNENSVYVKFKVKAQKFKDQRLSIPLPVYILAWTTTPWTLPGNVALAVGKDIDYVLAEKSKEVFILAKELAEKVLGSGYKILQELKGGELVGTEYEPLFDIKELKSENSYKVYDADFVSTQDGTGVVHTAVMYGEDDYALGTKLGLPKFHTVNEGGKFENVDKELDGLFVKSKKTEEIILNKLRVGGNLFKEESYEHDYPFCWRCSTPLLYYAKTSWFIKTSAVKENLLANNSKINWHPDHLKEGRFGQWLKEGKDWAFSRERYWGTPLPVWQCNKCDSGRVVGSIAELEKYHYGKKNHYFLIRHSLSTRNENSGSITINSDLEKDHYHLTEEGIKLAENEAEKIDAHGGVDVIFSSPFLRTKETAEIIGKRLHIKIHEDERLREIGHAFECEGKAHTVCPLADKNADPFTRSHDHSGENWNDVRIRLMDFVKDIEARYTGKRILIVSHGTPLFLFKMIGQGLTPDQILGETHKDGWEPRVADLHRLSWRLIPRNDNGELDLHRPFIDAVKLRCSKCRASMTRVPDLVDVWFDSGAMPYAQWHWPFENKDIFRKQFPADYISEGIDQTRGWFYTLLAISTFLGKGNPYKNVTVNGHTLDEKGKKMSKSLGNVMGPDELIDLVGADASRWYFYTGNVLGENMVVTVKGAQEKFRGFIGTLDNCLRFYELYAEGITNYELRITNLLDKWVLSRQNSMLAEVTHKLDNYDPTGASRAIESYVVEDLSNWWLRRSRKRADSLPLLKELLLGLAKVISPFTPFMAEEMFLRLGGQGESVHLSDWPAANKRSINLKLESMMDEVREIVTKGLAVRKERQLKVRQPLRSVKIKRNSKFDKDLEGLIKEELNVKEVVYNKEQPEDIVLDDVLDNELIAEGIANELTRQLQDMRKELKFNVHDKARAVWQSDNELIAGSILKHQSSIEETTSTSIKRAADSSSEWSVKAKKEFDIIPGGKIKIGIK